jgi:GT2 family glycosyltransferase
VLSPDIWEYILNVKKGEFKMTWYDDDDYPCGRVTVIRAEDFWRVGGFDEQVKILGEDRIFYLTAMRKGLRFMRIPTEYIRHIEHERRSKQGVLKVKTILENVRNFAYYGFSYCSVKDLLFLKQDDLNVRSVFIKLCGWLSLLYYVLKRLVDD